MAGMRQKETSMRRTLDPPDTSGSRDRIGLSFHSFGPAPKEWRRPAGRRHRVFGAGAAQLHREGRTTMFQLAIWIGSWQKTDTPAGRGCTLPQSAPEFAATGSRFVLVATDGFCPASPLSAENPTAHATPNARSIALPTLICIVLSIFLADLPEPKSSQVG